MIGVIKKRKKLEIKFWWDYFLDYDFKKGGKLRKKLLKKLMNVIISWLFLVRFVFKKMEQRFDLYKMYTTSLLGVFDPRFTVGKYMDL
jgi:hypothetical protein